MILKKLVISATDTIFKPLQEIGVPKRKPVKTQEDFLAKAVKFHGDSPVHANLHENKIIQVNRFKKEYVPVSLENIFFDFDVPRNLKVSQQQGIEMVEKDIEIVIKRLHKRGFTDQDIIKVWTTKKGSHLHVRIKKVEGLENQDYALEIKRKLIGFQKTIATNCETADGKVFGDFSRIARVPGISRPENRMIPVVVDHTQHLMKFLRGTQGYGELVEYGVERLYNWGNGVQELDNVVEYNDYKHIKVFATSRIDTSGLGEYGFDRSEEVASKSEKGDLLKFFKNYMPHPVAQAFCSPSPEYNYRLVGARCLFEAGMSVEIVANLIASIGWDSFDYDVTLENLRHIKDWNST